MALDMDRSPDSTPRPHGPPTDSDEYGDHQDDRGKPTHLRFLVTHAEAGCIIGKGGSTVTGFQSQSGARIKISRSYEFFPGTSDRVLLVSGLLHQVMEAMELILEKLVSEGDQVIDSEATIVLVVPDNSCGALIGKGGATIKSLSEESHTGLKIAPQDNSYGLSDRLLIITGPLDNQLQAIFFILSKLLEDNVHYPFPDAGLLFRSYPASPVGYENRGSDGHSERYQSMLETPKRSPDNNDAQDSLTIAIADNQIGAVLGRAGAIIKEIIQASGALIKISSRGDFIAGTCDREVMIRGTSEAIHAAEAMIMQRVSARCETA